MSRDMKPRKNPAAPGKNRARRHADRHVHRPGARRRRCCRRGLVHEQIATALQQQVTAAARQNGRLPQPPLPSRRSRWRCRASRVIRSRKSASSSTTFCRARPSGAGQGSASRRQPRKSRRRKSKKEERKEDAKESKQPLFLQAGSFSTAQDADNQKAKLAFMGVEAVVQQVMVQDKTYYRVRVGPYTKIDELNKMRAELAKAGIESPTCQKHQGEINET